MRKPLLTGLDHVAIPVPAGRDDECTAYYGRVLGLRPVAKPVELRKNGGSWWELPDGRQIHLQEADGPFMPLVRAHPAFRCSKLDELASQVTDAGFTVEWDCRYEGVRRFYTCDAFGNRLEFLDR